MKISADINKVEIVNGKALSGEFNVRDIELELAEELTACQNCFLVVVLKNGTSIDCPIEGGEVEFPCILKPQNLKIGVYAYDMDDSGKITKCYSPEPCNFFVDLGSYKEGGNSPHVPSPEEYTKLKMLMAKAEQTSNKVTEITEESTDEQYPSAKAVYDIVSESGKIGFTQALSNALKIYFNNIQTLLPQIAYVTEDNIGNALIQNAKDIVSVLENQPSEEPEEPDTPTDKTLVSISATYTGGNVAVGKDVSSLTDVIVTATYSDGSTSDVTDYTLSGEFAEGENTITVIYEGLTTTFTVIGEEVSIDENAVNIYTGFLGMDSTSTSEPTTNDTYPNAVCSEVMYKPSIGDGYDEYYTYDVKLNSNITDTSKINWKTYASSGARASSLTGDTISGIKSDYGVRLNILDQTATADGSNAVIEGFTITVNASSGVKGIFEYGINDLRG